MDPLGRRIRRYRDAAGLTRNQIAVLIRNFTNDEAISVQSVRNWEKGLHEARRTYLEAYAQACGVSFDELVGTITGATGPPLILREVPAKYQTMVNNVLQELQQGLAVRNDESEDA